MSTKRIVAGAISLLGLLACAQGAHAAVTEATAFRTQVIGYEPDGITPITEVAKDSWRVVVEDQGGGIFGVMVQAKTGPDGDGDPAALPTTRIHSVKLTFFDFTDPNNPSTRKTVLADQFFVPFGNTKLGDIDGDLSDDVAVGGNWSNTWADRKSVDFRAPLGDPDIGLDFNKSNYFLGYLKLSNQLDGGGTVTGNPLGFHATLFNDSIGWDAFGSLSRDGGPNPPDLTPEGSGAAALLPALLPIGLVALKRRKANKKEAAAA